MEEDFHAFLREQFSDRIEEAHHSIMITGGAAELPLQYYFANFTDMDVMFFYDDCCAILPDAKFPANVYKIVYTIESIPEYPGYANLRHGTDLIGKRDIVLNHKWPINGPANRIDLILDKSPNTKQKVDSELMTKLQFDMVSSIISPNWPAQANEWVTRKRNYGWPSSELVNQIVKGGCHFVAKPHPKCPNNEEMFRFSFSRAEVVLINSWNPILKYVYHVIRLVKKDVEFECRRDGRETVLCTYHFKTLLLWACEEKPPEFWNQGNLENCLQELFYQMIEWLIEKRCPSYFLPEYNLFDHLPEDFDFEKEIDILIFIGERICQKLMSVPIVDPNSKVSLQINNRILVYLHLLLSKQDYLRSPLQSDWTIPSFIVKDFPLVSLEFRKLYRGILDHLCAVRHSCIDSCAVRSEIGSRALKFLTEAVLDDNGISQTVIGLAETLSRFLENLLRPLAVNIENNSEDNSLEKSLHNDATSFHLSSPHNAVISVSCTKEEVSESSRHADVTVTSSNRQCQRDVTEMSVRHIYPRLNEGQKTEGQEENVKNFYGSTASVLKAFRDFANDRNIPKASYFVSAAYLANFYYTFQKKYDLALTVCKEALTKAEKLHESITKGYFYERKCSVIFTSKLMPIFDGQIQAVFGFVMLSFSVKYGKEKKSMPTAGEILHQQDSGDGLTDQSLLIVHRLHPFHFLQYIAFRCVVRTRDLKTGHSLINIECSDFTMSRILQIAIDMAV